jgi:hypothetical protein
MGIIDILQEWNLIKRAERCLKSFLLCQNSKGISVMPPVEYAERFEQRVIGAVIEKDAEGSVPVAATIPMSRRISLHPSAILGGAHAAAGAPGGGGARAAAPAAQLPRQPSFMGGGVPAESPSALQQQQQASGAGGVSAPAARSLLQFQPPAAFAPRGGGAAMGDAGVSTRAVVPAAPGALAISRQPPFSSSPSIASSVGAASETALTATRSPLNLAAVARLVQQRNRVAAALSVPTSPAATASSAAAAATVTPASSISPVATQANPLLFQQNHA